MKKYYINNKQKLKAIVNRCNDKYPEKYLVSRSKHNAKTKGLEHSITAEDIYIPTHCPYLGIELVISSGTKRAFNKISLDRIDSTKGYVKGNVQVISDLANRMKQDATIEQLLTFAQGVLKIHGGIHNTN